ncbi:MAG: hypothetical protein HS104_06180 [Polyangiaceae bacterium]|nr:hypothetical protein [Polyangiaceae bacterium]MCL4755643.1 hypothetical protein [Myxococcales bacterium]
MAANPEPRVPKASSGRHRGWGCELLHALGDRLTQGVQDLLADLGLLGLGQLQQVSRAGGDLGDRVFVWRIDEEVLEHRPELVRAASPRGDEGIEGAELVRAHPEQDGGLARGFDDRQGRAAVSRGHEVGQR